MTKKPSKPKIDPSIKNEITMNCCPNCQDNRSGNPLMTDEGKYYLCPECGYKSWK